MPCRSTILNSEFTILNSLTCPREKLKTKNSKLTTHCVVLIVTEMAIEMQKKEWLASSPKTAHRIRQAGPGHVGFYAQGAASSRRKTRKARDRTVFHALASFIVSVAVAATCHFLRTRA
jgi:hypothetical protein